MLNIADYDMMKSIVLKYFGEKWLATTGTHPIQILWNRTDDVANQEIYFLGKSIQRLLECGTEKTLCGT